MLTLAVRTLMVTDDEAFLRSAEMVNSTPVWAGRGREVRTANAVGHGRVGVWCVYFEINNDRFYDLVL